MKKVKIYSTPSCVYCNKAKQLFKENNISFEEYNVATDEQKRNEMVEITGQMGVPVIQVDDEVIVGYDRGTLSTMLGLEVKA